MRNITNQYKLRDSVSLLIIAGNKYKTVDCVVKQHADGKYLLQNVAPNVFGTPICYMVPDYYLSYCNCVEVEEPDSYVSAKEFLPELDKVVIVKGGGYKLQELKVRTGSIGPLILNNPETREPVTYKSIITYDFWWFPEKLPIMNASKWINVPKE